jgi:hypothetical protein
MDPICLEYYNWSKGDFCLILSFRAKRAVSNYLKLTCCCIVLTFCCINIILKLQSSVIENGINRKVFLKLLSLWICIIKVFLSPTLWQVYKIMSATASITIWMWSDALFLSCWCKYRLVTRFAPNTDTYLCGWWCFFPSLQIALEYQMKMFGLGLSVILVKKLRKSYICMATLLSVW